MCIRDRGRDRRPNKCLSCPTTHAAAPPHVQAFTQPLGESTYRIAVGDSGHITNGTCCPRLLAAVQVLTFDFANSGESAESGES